MWRATFPITSHWLRPDPHRRVGVPGGGVGIAGTGAGERGECRCERRATNDNTPIPTSCTYLYHAVR